MSESGLFMIMFFFRCDTFASGIDDQGADPKLSSGANYSDCDPSGTQSEPILLRR